MWFEIYQKHFIDLYYFKRVETAAIVNDLYL